MPEYPQSELVYLTVQIWISFQRNDYRFRQIIFASWRVLINLSVLERERSRNRLCGVCGYDYYYICVLSGRMRALYSNVQDSAYPLFRYSNSRNFRRCVIQSHSRIESTI